ncbi:helix-turn-helix transcriptional regulator [Nakamurella endophytica]|uniref:helix-turn-helix transcriptional regulator n=1 Tax=Nakamurella endophytica TaxID=1748367 RepID=UPI00166BD248|nr:LuxR family transcriptional regulator [Nakamurella endophytica]
MTGASSIVGRTAELALLRTALAAADSGRSQFVLLTAPAGMGKSTLVEAALSAVPHRLVRVLADPLESSTEYGALAQLAPVLSGAAAAPWPHLAAGAPVGASVLAVGAELVRVLGDLEPGRLLVLLVEDAQWLDGATAAAVQFAVRRLTVERALVVVTTRGGVRSVDLGWQRPSTAAGSGAAVELGPLTEDDVAELARRHHGRRLAPAAAARLAEQTGGHPLHARLIVETASWEQLSAVSGPLPLSRSLAGAIAASFEALSPAARSVVAAAAVVGRPVEIRMLQAVAGVADPTPVVEEAVAAGLLRETLTALGRTLGVPHPLIVTAVRDALEPAHRRAIEAAVLPFLSGETALRHRLGAVQGYDEALAVEATEAAAARELVGHLDGAIGLLLSAADISPDPELRARRFLRAVGLMATQGDIVRAFSCRADVLAAPPSSERTVVLAALTLLAGQLSAGRDLLAQARQELVETPDARLEASVSLLEATRKVLTGTDGMADVDGVLANPGAHPAWRQLARVLGAMSQMIAGRPEDAVAMVQVPPAVGGVLDSGDVPLLATRGGIRLWTGDDGAAAADLALVEQHIRAGRPVPALLALSLALIAEWRLLSGHWTESMATVELLLAVEEGDSRAVERPIVHAVAARVLAEHGQDERALEQLQAARAWTELLGSQTNRVYVAIAAAVQALLNGDPAAAAAELDAVERPEIQLRARERRLLRASALLAAGSPGPAARVAGDVVGHPGSVAAEALVVLAEATLAAGDLPDADAVLRSASSAIPADNAFLRAREAQVRGEMALRTGNVRAATAALTVARGLFAGIGAWPRVAQCENRLADLQSDRPPAGGPPLLSDRELEVARLVALGLSNGEAAARLYVSRKAIEFHLTNVYAKLGISSRRQLADRLQRLLGSPTGR